MVPNLGTQKIDPPAQDRHPPASENMMIEDSAPAQPVDTTTGGIDTTIGDDDVMIDVEGFYSDHLEDSHQEPTTGNEDEDIPTNNAAAPISPLTAMDVDEEQYLEVSNALGVQNEISQVNADATPLIQSPLP